MLAGWFLPGGCEGESVRAPLLASGGLLTVFGVPWDVGASSHLCLHLHVVFSLYVYRQTLIHRHVCCRIVYKIEKLDITKMLKKKMDEQTVIDYALEINVYETYLVILLLMIWARQRYRIAYTGDFNSKLVSVYLIRIYKPEFKALLLCALPAPWRQSLMYCFKIQGSKCFLKKYIFLKILFIYS